MRTLLLSSALVVAGTFGAQADQPFSSGDVANFLVDSVDLGLNRGICIGTARNAPEKA